MEKFIRYCKVIFADSSDGIIYFIEGGANGGKARISFEVERSIHSPYGICSVTIFNLTEETTAKIKNAEYVKLEAGYLDNYGIIFHGKVYDISTKQFLGKETTFYVAEGKDELSKWIKIQMNAGSSLRSVLLELANQSKIEYQNIEKFGEDLDSTIYKRGYPFAGSIKECLRQICSKYNKKFVYSPVSSAASSGKILFFDTEESAEISSRNVFEATYGLNVIAADYSSRERDFRERYFRERSQTTRRATTAKKVKVTNMECLFDYNVKLNTRVKYTNSAGNQSFYKIKAMQYIGDTHTDSDAWKVNLELYA